MSTIHPRRAGWGLILATLLTLPAVQAADFPDGTSSSLIVQAGEMGFELSLNGGVAFRTTSSPVQNERAITVPDSSIVLLRWDEVQAADRTAPFYAISLDGKSIVRVCETTYALKLRPGDFDPAMVVPPVDGRLTADANCNLYLVQFVTQPLEVFRAQIQSLGGTVRSFVANHAHIVEMTPATRSAVEQLPYVRWVGPYHPAYRLEEALRVTSAPSQKEVLPTQRYNIQVFEAGLGQKPVVAERIRALGGYVNRADAGKFLIEATLTPEQLFEVARWNEVLFIDRWSNPAQPDMNNAREYGGANYIEMVFPTGYAGEGVRGEVYDTGFNMSHVDFESRPLIVHGSSASDSHGASTSGICFGDGTGDPNARGLLPAGQGIVSYYADTMGTPSRYDHTGELVEDPYYGVFQTSSVGSDRTTQYTTISADTDAALFDFDVVHCQSQSNAGDQMSRPQAWAKNIISGGAVNHYDTLDPSDDCWCYGASIGPATDGRIKPDLCAYYDDILTTTTGGTTAYTTGFGGTSGATPIIAGHMGLFFQMWADGIFGNEVEAMPPATVFDNRSHMTTAKAMMINNAKQYPFSGTSHDLTRVHQGWGFPDLQRMHDMRDKTFVIDESEILEPFQSVLYALNVEPEEPEFRATLIFADPPGNPAAAQARINDLTLMVTAPNGDVYWGNHGLLEGNYSIPNEGSPNTVDTVENVFVESPDAGLWTVEIFADEIIEDGHVETPELDADFALVVTGVSPCLSAGSVRMDGSLYPCDGSVDIRVLDCDLNTDDELIETVIVMIASNSEPVGEAVMLTETAPATASFWGSIELSTTDGEGVLLVAHDDIITATYIDEDDGMGGVDVELTDTATIDCVPPAIDNVEAIEIEPRSAKVTFDADELVRGTVHYGLSCFALNETATSGLYSLSPVISLHGLDDDTTYFFKVSAEDAAGNVTDDPDCYTFTTPEVPDFFTEEFGSGFDLGWQRLTFTPNGTVDFYDACVEPIEALPTDPAGGTTISLSDDDYQSVSVSGGQVSFYGESYSTVFIGSNGYVTFDSGDSDYTESLDDHFDQIRISALFDDLNPSTGGSVSYKSLLDRFVVTFEAVPEYSAEGANTFQIELFRNGVITISYTDVSCQDALVGLSEGAGLSPDYYGMDLSELGDCILIGDLNCSGIVDFFDVDPFVLAITEPAAYATQYPDCDIMSGDCNGDGIVNFFDIDAFVELVTGP